MHMVHAIRKAQAYRPLPLTRCITCCAIVHSSLLPLNEFLDVTSHVLGQSITIRVLGAAHHASCDARKGSEVRVRRGGKESVGTFT